MSGKKCLLDYFKESVIRNPQEGGLVSPAIRFLIQVFPAPAPALQFWNKFLWLQLPLLKFLKSGSGSKIFSSSTWGSGSTPDFCSGIFVPPAPTPWFSIQVASAPRFQVQVYPTPALDPKKSTGGASPRSTLLLGSGFLPGVCENYTVNGVRGEEVKTSCNMLLCTRHENFHFAKRLP